MRLKRLTVFLALLTATPNVVAQDWYQVDGPHAGTILSILQVGESVFVGSSGRGSDVAYFSDNDLQSWKQIWSEGLHIPDVWAIYRSNLGYDYISARNYILRSADEGRSWERIFPAPRFGAIGELGEHLYGGSSTGLYESDDFGETWALTELNELRIYEIATTDDAVYAGISSSDNPTYAEGVFTLRQGAQDWQQVGFEPLHERVNSLAVFGSRLYAATGDGLWRIDLNGSNAVDGVWERVATTIFDGGVSAIAFATWNEVDRLFVSAGRKVYASQDGSYWQQIEPDLPSNVISIAVFDETRLLVGHVDDDGLSVLGDAVDSPRWQRIGIPVDNTRDLASMGNGLLLGVFGHNNVLQSDDDGETWYLGSVSLRFPEEADRIRFGPDGVFYAILDDVLMWSDDDGTTWNEMQLPPRYVSDIEFTPSGLIFIADVHTSQTSILRAQRGESSWQQIYVGRSRLMHFADGRLMVADCNGNRVVVTEDDGATWRETSIPACPLYFATTTDGVSYVGLAHNSLGSSVIRSDDYFLSWEDTNINELPVTGLEAGENGVVYQSSEDAFYASEDYGHTWESYSSGLPPTDGYHCEIELIHKTPDHHIVIATDECGNYRSVRPRVVGLDESLDEISQSGPLVWPNPIRSGGSLSIRLDYSGPLDISVIDSRGRTIVETLASRYQNLGYQLDVPPNLVPGRYTALIRVGDHEITAGFIVVR